MESFATERLSNLSHKTLWHHMQMQFNFELPQNWFFSLSWNRTFKICSVAFLVCLLQCVIQLGMKAQAGLLDLLMEGRCPISPSSSSEVMQDVLQRLVAACFVNTATETLYSDIVTSLWKTKLTQMFSFVWTLLKTHPCSWVACFLYGSHERPGSDNSKTPHAAVMMVWCFSDGNPSSAMFTSSTDN